MSGALIFIKTGVLLLVFTAGSLFMSGCESRGSKDSMSVSGPVIGAPDTIRVAFIDEQVSGSEVVSDYELIFLKTDGLLIGTVSKLLLVKDRIIISDRPNDRIYCFNSTGELLHYIEKPGYGPEEYIQIKDFGVDLNRETIEVLDMQGQKVVRYDLHTGAFLDKIKYDFYTSTFSPVGGGQRIFHNSTIPNGSYLKVDSLDAGLFVTDSTNHILQTLFSFDETGLDRVRLITLDNIFLNSDHEVLYIPLYHNTIYNASDRSFEARYFMDFGNRQLPGDFLLKFNDHESAFIRHIRKSDYAYSLSNFFETSTHITFTFYMGGGYYRALYDKGTQKCYAYRRLSRGPGGFRVEPKGVVGDRHVSIASSEALKKLKSIFESNLDRAVLSTHEMYQSLVRAIESNDADNPVLVLHRFKTIE